MKFCSKFCAATAFAGVLGLSACTLGQATAPPAQQIVSTTSFGMCAGYCNTRLEISEGQAVFIRNGHGRGVPDLPERRTSAPLTADEWRDFAQLAADTDLSGLPDTIGCPDCADGGAESLTVGARTITFDYGATIQQAQPLLDRIRALRQRLTPADEREG